MQTDWKVHQLILYCLGGVMGGVVGGLLGLGGGFILGPLFLELGLPPQVCFILRSLTIEFCRDYLMRSHDYVLVL